MKKVRVLRIVRDYREEVEREYEQATTLEQQNIARGKCAAADLLYLRFERE